MTPRQPDVRAPLLLTLLFVARSRCRWRRTSPASTAPIPGAENRELAAFPRVDGIAGVDRRAAGRRSAAWFDDHFGFRSRLVRWYGESRLFVLRRVAVGGGRQRRARLVLLRRRQVGRGLRQRRADDRRGAGELARGGPARARLAARARHRLRLHDRARQARDLRRGDAGDAGARRRPVARRSAVHGAAGHRARRGRARRRCSRPRRASASISRPTPTGTTAARWSRISRSSSAVRARVPRDAAGLDARRFRSRSIARSRDWIWPA